MLTTWQLIALTFVTTIFMEGVAWFTHKYLMHGVLWFLHKSHHSHRRGWFEINDVFAVFFTLQSVAMILIGLTFPTWNWMFAVGLGVAIYGVFYAIFHDILVHNRLPFLQFKPQNSYLKRIIKAHGAHHRSHKKDGGEAFGFLYAPKKYKVKE